MLLPARPAVHERYIAGIKAGIAPPRDEPYQDWLARHFPEITHHPLAERHHRLWTWFISLTPPTANRQPPTPRIEVWPRGGAKSTTAELACAYLGTRLTRRFVLYVSATQAQADIHVQSIAGYLEQIGIERAISKYGTSRGWRRNQLRTADGYNVAAYGLDGASRGIKLGRHRPDLIVFDDIDRQADTSATVRKKIEAITTAILPTGSPDCAILFLQNLIHEDSVVAQLVDGRAQFLANRETHTEPAVRNLQTAIASTPPPPGGACERSELGEGSPALSNKSKPNNLSHSSNRSGPVTPRPSLVTPAPNSYRIVAGQPTWPGQSLETCEKQINEWGLRAFLREAQHEVQNAQGYFFDTSKFEIVQDAPSLQGVCLAWDLAATEGAGDHTVAALMGKSNSGVIYVLFVLRVQRSSEAVRELILKWSTRVRDRFTNYSIHLPQDPGQAGKAQADSLRRLLTGFQNIRIETVSGAKAVRASNYAEQVNLGNVKLLRAPWNAQFIEEHRKFREQESHEHDDQVDAASDAFNNLQAPTEARQFQTVRTNPTYATQYSRMRQAGSPEEDDDEDD